MQGINARDTTGLFDTNQAITAKDIYVVINFLTAVIEVLCYDTLSTTGIDLDKINNLPLYGVGDHPLLEVSIFHFFRWEIKALAS